MISDGASANTNTSTPTSTATTTSAQSHSWGIRFAQSHSWVSTLGAHLPLVSPLRPAVCAELRSNCGATRGLRATGPNVPCQLRVSEQAFLAWWDARGDRLPGSIAGPPRNLVDARLVGADLTGADLNHAVLTDADLTDVRWARKSANPGRLDGRHRYGPPEARRPVIRGNGTLTLITR